MLSLNFYYYTSVCTHLILPTLSHPSSSSSSSLLPPPFLLPLIPPPMPLLPQSLLLLHYLVCNGSERVVTSAREHIYDMKALEEYVFRDEHGKDQGLNGEQWEEGGGVR